MIYYQADINVKRYQMFCSFKNMKENIILSGAPLIELQYCKLNKKSKTKKIVSANKINFLKDDSLYLSIDDTEKFDINYGDIIYGGTYSNLKSGKVDWFGVNYFSLQQLVDIIDKIEEYKPLDYEILLDWLKQGLNYNGFYILGV